MTRDLRDGTSSLQNFEQRSRRSNLCCKWCALPPFAFSFLLSAFCLPPSALCQAQTAIHNPQSQIQNPTSDTKSEADAFPACEWAPELLDAILSSPNAEARDAMLEAAFTAGPDIIPQLQAALKDDRTAEFAAQSLAFIGGAKALETLAQLVSDPRDLNLRRFYYGALGEFQSPQASQVLLYALNRADAEPDRMVTEAAILSLTVHSDLSLIAPLRQAEAKTKDVVIHDDIDNALEVIQSRARYLASPEGKKAGGSIEQAVRTYFMPALQSATKSPQVKPGEKPSAASAAPTVKMEVQHLAFSPDRTRALAHAILDAPAATAYYSVVLQKQLGDWTVASVWLGSQVEKPTKDSDE